MSTPIFQVHYLVFPSFKSNIPAKSCHVVALISIFDHQPANNTILSAHKHFFSNRWQSETKQNQSFCPNPNTTSPLAEVGFDMTLHLHHHHPPHPTRQELFLISGVIPRQRKPLLSQPQLNFNPIQKLGLTRK